MGGYTMSRILNIIVEGVTEKEFVMNCMYHHLLKNGISNIRVIKEAMLGMQDLTPILLNYNTAQKICSNI